MTVNGEESGLICAIFVFFDYNSFRCTLKIMSREGSARSSNDSSEQDAFMGNPPDNPPSDALPGSAHEKKVDQIDKSPNQSEAIENPDSASGKCESQGDDFTGTDQFSARSQESVHSEKDNLNKTQKSTFDPLDFGSSMPDTPEQFSPRDSLNTTEIPFIPLEEFEEFEEPMEEANQDVVSVSILRTSGNHPLLAPPPTPDVEVELDQANPEEEDTQSIIAPPKRVPRLPPRLTVPNDDPKKHAHFVGIDKNILTATESKVETDPKVETRGIEQPQSSSTFQSGPTLIESPRIVEKPKPIDQVGRRSSSFNPIDFDSNESTDVESVDGMNCTEEVIDEMLQSLKNVEKHLMSRDSLARTPAADDNEGIFSTEPPKQQMMLNSGRPQSELTITPLDLKNLMVDEEPPDEETEKILKRFKKTGRVPISVKSGQLIPYMQRNRVNALLHGDYDKAKEYDEMSKEITIALTKTIGEERKQSRITQLQNKLEDEKNQHFMFRREWLQRISKEEDLNKQRLAELNEKQEKDLLEFEQKWNNEDYLRRYTKPSTQLLQMKAMERSMVIAKMYDQAKMMRKSASIIEKRESTESQQRAKQEMVVERQRLVDKQNHEFLRFKEKCEQQIVVLKKNMTVDERPYLARISKIEREIIHLKTDQEIPVLPNSVQTAEVGEELLTSRTAYKFSAYKATAQNPKLKIKPLGQVTKSTRKRRVIRLRAATGMK